MTTDIAPQDKPSVYFDESAEVWVYRASAASRCETELIYWRMGVEGDPPPADMQDRFDDGHLHESAILEKVTKETGWHPMPVPDFDGAVGSLAIDGISFESDQWGIEIPVMDGVVIRGHLDGIFMNQNFDGLRVVEAKALSKSSTESWLQAGFDAFPYYRDQLTLYMHGADIDQAIFAVKNKDSGKVHLSYIDGLPGDVDEILRRIMVIEGKARAGIVPDECDRPGYPCPFFRLHEDQVDDKTQALVAAADSLDQLLAEYAVAREDEKAAKERKDEARDQIMELVGKDEVYNGTVWTVKQDRKTRKRIDYKQMESDGIDVDFYTTESYYYAINVGRSK